MALICHHGTVTGGECSVVTRASAPHEFLTPFLILPPCSPLWSPVQVILAHNSTWAK